MANNPPAQLILPPLADDMALWAVIPAGGNGTRYSSEEDKLLAPLPDGQPVLTHALRSLLAAEAIRGVVIAAGTTRLSAYEKVLRQALTHLPYPDLPLVMVSGGATRRESVWNALQAILDEVTPTMGMIAVHDAARPFVPRIPLREACQCVHIQAAGAILACPLRDTVKKAEKTSDDSRYASIVGTLDRQQLWRAQTPQVFRADRLIKAHQAVPLTTAVTDDAQLLELAGLGPVTLISSPETNLKITTPDDLAWAGFLYERTAQHTGRDALSL